MKFVDEPGNSALAWVTFNSSGSDGKTNKLELSVNMHYSVEKFIGELSIL